VEPYVGKTSRLTKKGSNLPISAISRETFHLPDRVVRKLTEVLEKVRSSLGFAIFEGLEPHKYCQIELVIIHVGLMAYLGGRRAMPGRQGGDNTVLRV
jgi:hypothetical protein